MNMDAVQTDILVSNKVDIPGSLLCLERTQQKEGAWGGTGSLATKLTPALLDIRAELPALYASANLHSVLSSGWIPTSAREKGSDRARQDPGQGWMP